MTDPERLLRQGSELERGLLTAGRTEEPSESALEGTLAAVGLGAAGAALGTAIGGSAVMKAGGTSTLLGLTLKWLGVGAAGGLVAMGAVTVVEHAFFPAPTRPSAATASAPPAATQPSSPNVAPAPPPSAEKIEPDEAPPKLVLPSSPAQSPTPGPSTEPSIAEELTALDDARSALASGNHARVIAILDAYDKRPGPHRMSQEAQYLRMEALSRAGFTAAAQIAAKGLLSASPTGPHAARAREILGSEKK